MYVKYEQIVQDLMYIMTNYNNENGELMRSAF